MTGKVSQVWYPGHASHPQHEVAAAQMDSPGAMLTFAVADSESALKVADSLELAAFGASLGGVRTTVQIPATMAFLDISPQERLEMGILDGMVRISTGLEDPEDLV